MELRNTHSKRYTRKAGLTREYSERLGVLSYEQLQAALNRFGLGELLNAKLAAEGLFGQIIQLETSSGTYAFRGNPHKGQLHTEQYFSRRLHHDTDVPVPWPYHVEIDTKLFGWEYAIMRWLPGIMCKEPTIWDALLPEDHLGITTALGSTLARLQVARWSAWGFPSEESDQIEPNPVPYLDHVNEEIESALAESLAASRATTSADARWLRAVVTKQLDALAVPFEPTFVHCDYKRANTVVEKDANGFWQVSGVFDLQVAHAGDGELDLSRAASELAGIDPELTRAFLDAYVEQRLPRDGFRDRYNIYMIRDRLGIWRYGQCNRVWFPAGLKLRQWLEPELDLQLSLVQHL